ncbi:MAG: hypothetical protein NTY65_00460, partial [Planctomycetota bacterium]|nr:hypothetical protein [Planctomycetota bacterium]
MKTPTLRRLLLAMLACASVAALPTTAQAATYSLAGDFSYTENRANSVWSFRMDDYANKPPAFLPLLASTNRNAKMLWGTGFAEPPMMWSEETGYWGMANEGGIIYDTKAAAVFLEMDHGPILVDNNVLVGQGVRSNSEGTVFAHNLFVDCAFEMVSDTQRRSQYYRPHTRTTVDRKSGVPQDDKWYSNIFIRRGLEKVKEAPGYASDGNLFLEGAGRSTFGDAHSVVDPLKTDFRREETPLG